MFALTPPWSLIRCRQRGSGGASSGALATTGGLSLPVRFSRLPQLRSVPTCYALTTTAHDVPLPPSVQGCCWRRPSCWGGGLLPLQAPEAKVILDAGSRAIQSFHLGLRLFF